MASSTPLVQRVLVWAGVATAAAVGLLVASAVIATYVLDTWNLVDALGGWGIAMAVGWPVLFAVLIAIFHD